MKPHIHRLDNVAILPIELAVGLELVQVAEWVEAVAAAIYEQHPVDIVK